MTGVAAGDTVYISGGAAGQMRTYAVSGWAPPTGTAGHPITYQIGQTAGYNGTAIFSGSGTFFGGAPNYVNFSGDAGDGQMHFQFTGYNSVLGNTGSVGVNNFHFSYVNLGTLAAGTVDVFYFGQTSAIELDHLWCSVTDVNADGFVVDYLPSVAAYDDTKFHDMTVYLVGDGYEWGPDGFRWGGNGVSIYNNKLFLAVNPATSQYVQHQDAVQCLWGSYCKVYNNYFWGLPDGINIATAVGPNLTDYLIYNNIVAAAHNFAIGVGDGSDGVAGGNIARVVLANNLVDEPSNGVQPFFFGLYNGGKSPYSFVNNTVANNIVINSTSGYISAGTATTAANVLNMTAAQAASAFVGYIACSTNSNYHLSSGATSLIGQGTSLSGYFVVDKDGKTRSGAWDIGPYAYLSNTNPAIQVSPTTLSFSPVLQGRMATNYFTVQNLGGGTLGGTAAITSGSSAFKIISGQSYSLGANQSAQVGVSYTPSSSSDSATVTFTGGGGATVAVTGSLQAVMPGLSFQSYAGTITSPFSTNGGYVSQSVTTTEPTGGRAVYFFNIPSAGSYTVAANVNAPDTSANSFYVNIDAEPTDPTNIWDVPVTTGFASRTVSWRGNGTDTSNQYSPVVFNLSAGVHQLIIVGREAGLQLGAITIAPYGQSYSPPVVSAITQSGASVDPNASGIEVLAGSSAQYSGSASDPNGLPLTWQWLYTVNGGAETVAKSGTGQVTSVAFNYSSGTGGNTYIWKLRVSNGYATAESDLTVGVEPPAVLASGLTLQAAAGAVTAPFVLSNGYVYQSVNTGVTNGGQVVFSFTVTNAGTYAIQALVNAADDSSNSFYVNVDGQPQDPSMVWDIYPFTSGFESRFIGWRGNGAPNVDQFLPKLFTLNPGVHQLIIVGREANTLLQQVSILKQPSPPPGPRVVAGVQP